MGNIETSLIYSVSLLIAVYLARDMLDQLWRRSRNEPLLLAAIGVPTAIILIGFLPWLAGAFTNGDQTDWMQIKEYVQALVLLMTPSGVLLGLHFAKQRTEAMQEQNDIQRQQNDEQRRISNRQLDALEREREERLSRDYDTKLSDAAKQLSTGNEMNFLDAVRKLKDLASTDERHCLQRAVDYMADYVRTQSPTARPEPISPIASRKLRQQLQTIMDTICDLIREAEHAPFVKLIGSDLSALRIKRMHPNIKLQGCFLTGSELIFEPLIENEIQRYSSCNFTAAKIIGDLRNAEFILCTISDTNFEWCSNIPVDCLTRSHYLASSPPIGLPEQSRFKLNNSKGWNEEQPFWLEKEEPLVISLPKETGEEVGRAYTLNEWQEKWDRGEFFEPLSREGKKMTYYDSLTASRERRGNESS